VEIVRRVAKYALTRERLLDARVGLIFRIAARDLLSVIVLAFFARILSRAATDAEEEAALELLSAGRSQRRAVLGSFVCSQFHRR
jgi:hypothetical protein